MLCEKMLLDSFLKKMMWHHTTRYVMRCDITWHENKLFFGKFTRMHMVLIWHDFCTIRFFERRVTQIFETKLFGSLVDFSHFGINFHLTFGNSHFTHTKVESQVVCTSEFIRKNTTCLGDLKLFGDRKVLEDFSKA